MINFKLVLCIVKTCEPTHFLKWFLFLWLLIVLKIKVIWVYYSFWNFNVQKKWIQLPDVQCSSGKSLWRRGELSGAAARRWKRETFRPRFSRLGWLRSSTTQSWPSPRPRWSKLTSRWPEGRLGSPFQWRCQSCCPETKFEFVSKI